MKSDSARLAFDRPVPARTERTVTLLGATGSIGTSTIDLLKRERKRFRVEAVSANTNAAALAALARELGARFAVVGDADCYRELKSALSGSGIAAAAGESGLIEAAERPAEWVIGAITGAAGLKPTLAAADRGAIIALANKETLVMAGSLMTAAARERGVALLPVDSEHSAVFQCLEGHNRSEVRRILLTASGGPFRTMKATDLAQVTVEQALNHPTWRMGAKITVDSATLMNKGLEVIEARWLFDVLPEKVQVVVHPQSVVHSLVEYVDGSVIAQLGVPDMGIPILYALTYPQRLPCPAERLDLTRVGALTFEEPDVLRFPCLALARQALLEGGCAAVILNAANEVAVAAFLEGRIRFTQIPELIAEALSRVPARALDGIDTCVDVDTRTRATVREWLPGGVVAAVR